MESDCWHTGPGPDSWECPYTCRFLTWLRLRWVASMVGGYSNSCSWLIEPVRANLFGVRSGGADDPGVARAREKQRARPPCRGKRQPQKLSRGQPGSISSPSLSLHLLLHSSNQFKAMIYPPAAVVELQAQTRDVLEGRSVPSDKIRSGLISGGELATPTSGVLNFDSHPSSACKQRTTTQPHR